MLSNRRPKQPTDFAYQPKGKANKRLRQPDDANLCRKTTQELERELRRRGRELGRAAGVSSAGPRVRAPPRRGRELRRGAGASSAGPRARAPPGEREGRGRRRRGRGPDPGAAPAPERAVTPRRRCRHALHGRVGERGREKGSRVGGERKRGPKIFCVRCWKRKNLGSHSFTMP